MISYIGSIISKTEDIKAKISKARQAFPMLKPVWSFTILSESTKIRIVNTYVKSVFLYRFETWRLTIGLQQKIQIFINKCLRHICKVTWPRKISNEQLLKRISRESTSLQIKKRKPKKNITREALDWNQ